jgi:crotonobetainyl-CoA:carnitine CoA-transferase CaiB-like acyl-CoA transferase
MSLRPLCGVRVMEVGSSIATAFGTRLLSDLGAEVVKIEPIDGDALRKEGPFLPSGTSALFRHLNHGKRIVQLADGTQGEQLLIDLARRSDVLVWASQDGSTANAPSTALLDQNLDSRPSIVLLSPFGRRGSRGNWVGSEFIAQYSGGYAYHQACPVSDPEATPPAGCADREAAMLAGLVVANASLWALAMPGDASKPIIDLSVEDVFAAMLIDPLADYHRGTQPPGRARVPGRSITIAGGLVWLLPCADGTILVSPREDHQWQRWVALMGSPAWANDAALCGSRETRTRHASELQKLMATWSVGERAGDVFARAQAARVACFPVSTAEDLIRNPQLAARRFFNTLMDPDGAEVLMPGLPFAMQSSCGAKLARGLTVTCAPPAAVPVDNVSATPPTRADPADSPSVATLPLTGVRVVDFSWVMAGPMATKMLGAMGAEIIKIESTTRPEFSFREAWFAVINNNKKSCTLDITTLEAQTILHDLVAASDVVVENFSSRVLTKNNLGYEHLSKIKPDIIFVSASGLGRTGPERDLLAYGSLLQAYSGRVSMIGRMNPELEAMGVMPAWTDPVTALWETLAILAALRHRQHTGEGCYIDLSMLEATVALLPDAILRAGLGQPQHDKRDQGELGATPSGCFRCAGEDSWLALSVQTDQQWRALCNVFGPGKLAMRSDLVTATGRHHARAELNRAVAAWCQVIRADEAEILLQSHGVPAARVRGIHDLVHDAHLGDRGAFRQLDDGSWTTTLPWIAGDGWRGQYWPTPQLGGDNGYVLGDILGISAERQEQLKRSGAIR